jgi:hypothetical protein
MRKHDWADELARQIATDFGVPNPLGDRRRYDLVAARLRVVKQEGIGEGLDQARDAVTTKGKTDATS